MANSLLAHLYTHIKGSQEDIATLSLHYILTQSDELNRAFTKRVANALHLTTDDMLQYFCQLTGENRERPDMSGNDAQGNECVLLEMKFYADLTKNQPCGYIERLKNNQGYGLVFVCPAVRMQSLWTRLKEECKSYGLCLIDAYCAEVDGIRMALLSWPDIIEMLLAVAATSAVDLIADIRQLEGFCAQMDSDAFIPFTERDLSASRAKSIERYYEVLDKIIELLCDDDSIVTDLGKMKASPYRRGYSRSIYVNNWGLTLLYDRTMWKNPGSIETPFWMYIKNNEWIQTKEILSVYSVIPDIKKDRMPWGMCLALEALTDVTLDEVCKDIKRQILEYIVIFENKLR